MVGGVGGGGCGGSEGDVVAQNLKIVLIPN